MRIDYGGSGGPYYSTIAGLIAAARNGGSWNQAGITSTEAKNHSPHITTLGVLEGSEFIGVYGSPVTFDGESVTSSEVLVKYTYYGDTDFNGQVNFDDYARTDNGFNNGRSRWLNGDFDYNNVINFDDYSLIDFAYNSQSGVLTSGPGGPGEPQERWAEIAQMWHFNLPRYKDRLIEFVFTETGRRLTDADFYPYGNGMLPGGSKKS